MSASIHISELAAELLAAPTNQNARRLLVPLRAEVADGALRHELDLGALEDALALPSTRLLMWCQPHNPSGRCWSAEEMAEVARLCVQHDVVLLSDEVWGEMPLEPDAQPFVSLLALLAPDEAAAAAAAHLADPDAPLGVAGLAQRLIVMTSPSKCFNVAPLDIATAIVPDDSLRRRFRRVGLDAAEVSIFGYTATLAAYGDVLTASQALQLLAAVAGMVAYLVVAAPMQLVKSVQAASIAIMTVSLLPQVARNFKEKSTGGWSPLSAFFATLGNAIRIFTTLSLTQDNLILAGFFVGTALNGLLLASTLAFPAPL